MTDDTLRAWLWPYEGIAAALAIAIGGAMLVAVGAPPALRAPAAVGLILWAPGFALTLAIFPTGAIGRVERTVLAVAASVALTAISRSCSTSSASASGRRASSSARAS